MQTDKLNILIGKYLDESISTAEKAMLAAMLEEEQYATAFRDLLVQQMKSRELELEPDEQIGQLIREQVQAKMQEPAFSNHEIAPDQTAPVRRLPTSRKWWWAAASVLVLAVATTWLMNTEKKDQPIPEKFVQAEIPAGSDGAILTLADGSQVVLDSVKNGLIAEQHGAKIMLTNGTMTYKAEATSDARVVYNTMSTPKGRQFQFSLPDGTMVWLNAASSIKYPTTLNKGNRVVEITGEAYFEVARNKEQPFIVKVGQDAAIEVLGTSFNVNAYTNASSIKTTLISGAVSVENISKDLPASTKAKVVLNPGQQAIVTPASRLANDSGNGSLQAITVNTSPDIDKITAWKKGLFNFEGSSLEEVMKELERWYDIDVVYEGKPPAIKFYGKMGKDLSLQVLLEVLTRSKVNFEIEGRKLIIKP